MKVVEIFQSIEGEGKRTGLPVIFIRLWGCNLQCAYCDTPYSWQNADSESVEKSIDEILEKLQDWPALKRVTITGGEPMIHFGFRTLLRALVNEGYEVNVETNGTQRPLRSELWKDDNKVFYTMDYKTASTGIEERLRVNEAALLTLKNTDVLKFVVGNTEDLEEMSNVLAVLRRHYGHDLCMPQVYVSPVFGKIEPWEIVDYIQDRPELKDVHVQVQLHKIIWAPDARGV